MKKKMTLLQRSMVWAANVAVFALPPLARAAGPSLPEVPIPIPPGVSVTPNLAAANTTLSQVCGLVQGASHPTAAQLDLAHTCSFLENPTAPAAAVGAAYQSLMGQQINALQPEFQLFEFRTDDLLNRLDDLRQSGAEPFTAAAHGGGSGDATTFLDGKLGLWADGKFQSADKNYSTNAFAYSIHQNAVTVGADYRITNSLVAGLGYTGSNTDVPFTANLGRMSLSENGVNLYTSYYRGTMYADLLAGYGNSTLQSTRNLNFSNTTTGQTVNQQAVGNSTVRNFFAGVSAGDTLSWRSWRNFYLTPEVSLTYRQAHLNPFTESATEPNAPGSGLVLSYASATLESLQLSGGVRIGLTLNTPWGVVQPQLHSAYVAELLDSPTTFNASFAAAASLGGGAATPIAIESDLPDSHFFSSGASISVTFTHGWSAFFDYDFLTGTHYVSDHTINLGVRYQTGG